MEWSNFSAPSILVDSDSIFSEEIEIIFPWFLFPIKYNPSGRIKSKSELIAKFMLENIVSESEIISGNEKSELFNKEERCPFSATFIGADITDATFNNADLIGSSLQKDSKTNETKSGENEEKKWFFNL